MLIPNKTHYYLDTSKVYQEVSSPDSWLCESGKRLAYYQRLYYEYEYTKSVNGLAFFYTLTYNDKSIPVWNDGQKDYYVFNYEHIRLVTNGRLSKVLAREYGARLRYICTCETGEDKGERGLGNNPHYHFIFFVSPKLLEDGTPDYEHYTKISPFRFRGLMREIWQGSTSFIRFQDARFGICREGDNFGVVDSPEGMKYVIKYVLKSDVEKNTLAAVTHYYERECLSHGYDTAFLFAFYKYQKMLNPFITKSQFYETYKLRSYNIFRKQHPCLDLIYWFKFSKPYGRGVSSWKNVSLLQKLEDFFDTWYYPNYVKFFVSKWKNMYSGKVRCSKSLGEYGLKCILEPDSNPHFKMYEKKQVLTLTPCLYYYRKLYYNTKLCPFTGNVLYYLNQRGIDLHCKMLPVRVAKLVTDTYDSVAYATMNKISVDIGNVEFLSVLDEHQISFDDTFLMRSCNLLFKRNHKDIIRRYAIYKLVYEHRHYSSFDTLIDDTLSIDSVIQDYRYFISQSCYNLDYHEDVLSELFLNPDTFGHDSVRNLHAFKNLPYFSPYLAFFRFLDLVRITVHDYKGQLSRERFLVRSEHQRRYNQFRFNGLGLLASGL